MNEQAPIEPVLELDDIQGIVVPGFFKPHQVLLCLRLPAHEPDRSGSLRCFKEFLSSLAQEDAEERLLSDGMVTIYDRRAFRLRRSESNANGDERVLVAIGFSAQGLQALTPGASAIPSSAFQQGLVARSPLLGDPLGTGTIGNPSTWAVGGANAELDALIVVAGSKVDPTRSLAEKITKHLEACSISVHPEIGDVLPGLLKGHEHFEFDDGVSQPGIRGCDLNGQFITERHVQGSPDNWLFGYPGQHLVWPGEFVLGYPRSSPDPSIPGRTDQLTPKWIRNGSFLVFRRLRQNVPLFWQTMRSEATRLRGLSGFNNLSDEDLASLLVGRRLDGTPVERWSAGGPLFGGDQFANNDFLFDSDTPPRPGDPYPTAKADPVGLKCPLGAHIRKVNTRDSSSDMGAASSTYERRLLRVGVPFGSPVSNRYDEGQKPETGERGLLFLSIQASIEEQFEFIQARWINDAARPRMPGGHDMIVGQQTTTSDGVRRCVVFGADGEQAQVHAAQQWVTPTGGGYFFVPSLSTIRDVLAREYP